MERFVNTERDKDTAHAEAATEDAVAYGNGVSASASLAIPPRRIHATPSGSDRCCTAYTPAASTSGAAANGAGSEAMNARSARNSARNTTPDVA